MHFRGDLGCSRGYEGWLAKEAKARNPDIKIWSLSWGVPGWVGNISGSPPTYYCDDNIDYQIAWLRCLKETWGVDSDYLGLWNERPQGSTDYVIKLKQELGTHGFGHVGITVEASWEELIRKAQTDSAFNASIVAGSAHYPCNATENSIATHNASKKWWAGEVSSQWKNPDFLLRNPDFLLKNPDFLLRNPDFLLNNVDFITKQVAVALVQVRALYIHAGD